MPYQKKNGRFQASQSIAHVPIVENELVKERLKAFRVFRPDSLEAIDESLVMSAQSLGDANALPKWVLSFDGSPSEVAVREEYPSTRVGYVQIAGVLVHLDQMLAQRDEHLVDPAAIHDAVEEAMHCMALPGLNVCRADMPTVRDSWRAEVFDLFRNYQVEDSPLIEVFADLAQHSDKHSTQNGSIVVTRCPATDGCSASNVPVSLSGGNCPQCGQTLYPTDALRLHEEVSEEHSNLTSLGRLMTSLEHLTMVAYLRYLARRRPTVLQSVAFILDGPLAVFGPQAWMHSAMQRFLTELGNDLQKRGLRCPIVLGIEKSGQFAEHAAAIANKLPTGSVMALPDDYVYSHVLTFRPDPGSAFGRDTYYGQKFFYKTSSGRMLTITVPSFYELGASAEPSGYPTLRDSLAMLDQIGTSLYADAVIPVALAHSYASIPLRTGSKVLKLLSQELLGQSNSAP